MFKDIKDYFQGTVALEKCFVDNESVTARDLALATCVLLVEVAASDHAIAQDEGSAITELVHNEFGVAKAEIPVLIKMAVSTRKQSGKLGQFVDLVAKHFNQEQKETVLYMVWCMILADGHIDANEEKLADRLAQYLKLSREQSLEAYQKAILKDNNDGK